jgi:hypothetical protein
VLISSFRLHPLADLTRLWEALHGGKVTVHGRGVTEAIDRVAVAGTVITGLERSAAKTRCICLTCE